MRSRPRTTPLHCVIAFYLARATCSPEYAAIPILGASLLRGIVVHRRSWLSLYVPKWYVTRTTSTKCGSPAGARSSHQRLSSEAELLSFPKLRTEPVSDSYDRSLFKTPDEQVAFEFGRLLELFGRARARSCTVDVFVKRVNEASKLGLTWVDALEFAAERHAIGSEKLPDKKAIV